VDAAKAIWIDAASVVTCRTSYTFSAGGLHNVAVRVQHCVPGDYDELHKELGGQIQIQNPNNMFYSASASESTNVTETTVNYYNSAASTVPDRTDHSSSSVSTQGRFFYGQIPSALNLPLKASYADSSGGASLNSISFQNLLADSTKPVDPTDPKAAFYTSVTTILRTDAVSFGNLNVKIYKNANTGAATTNVEWSWPAGAVTYHSDGYCSTAGGYLCVGGDYTPNTPGHSITQTFPMEGYGPLVALKANYVASVVVDDGTSYSASPSMDLVPTAPRPPTTYPAVCTLTWPKSCTQTSRTSTGKSGNAVLLQ
jgi:hypothetical protein